MRNRVVKEQPRRVNAKIVAAVVAALFLSGCVPTASAPTSSPVPSAGREFIAPKDPVVFPLRGTIADSEASLAQAQQPTLTVKIDNHELARPQIGLNDTDIVFEELVEGGYTRYAAVWQSKVPTKIGPVRSIRPMDPDIISPLGGIVVYSGGQQRFVDLMKATAVKNLVFDYDPQHFARDRDRIAPHNVILDAQDAVASYAGTPASRQQFVYALHASDASASKVGKPANNIELRFSSIRYPSWVWDETTRTYLRSQENKPDLGAARERISATNVIALKVSVEAGDVPKTVLEGTGEAWFMHNGAVVEGNWSKSSRDDSLRFTDAQGFSIFLAPGNTWVELIPAATGTVTVG